MNILLLPGSNGPMSFKRKYSGRNGTRAGRRCRLCAGAILRTGAGAGRRRRFCAGAFPQTRTRAGPSPGGT